MYKKNYFHGVKRNTNKGIQLVLSPFVIRYGNFLCVVSVKEALVLGETSYQILLSSKKGRNVF